MATPGYDHQKYPGAGYPPPYPQPYPGYPPPPYQGYPPGNPSYPQAPPAAYYYSQQQQHHLPSHEPSLAFRVIRFFLTVMIFLLLGLFTMSVLTRVIFRSDLPRFHVDSLTVHDFNATGDSLKASWDMNLTVSNINDKVNVSFGRMDGYIGILKDVIANFIVDSFHVGPNGNNSFNLKFSTLMTKEHDNNTALNYTELAEHRKSGTMFFDLKMRGTTTSTTPESHLQRHGNLFVYCFSLEVRFPDATGPGYLVDNKKRDSQCLVWE